MSQSGQRLELLNLGCGNRFHPEWTNVDFRAIPPLVMQADLSKSVPFPTGSFDVVYHSHLLEHFRSDVALRFLRECHRVLRAGGALRVVVPDLEGIARLYLDRLERVLAGDGAAEADYEWMMLELYDQTVRTRSGGEMKRYLAQPLIPNLEFVRARTGWLRESADVPKAASAAPVRSPPAWQRFLRPSTYAERLKRVLLGAEYEILQEGRFRRGGEIHAWMYDRFSLARLLGSVGFIDIRKCTAQESLIPNWDSYRLDTVADGSVRKPDSLFMECRKPG